MIRLTRQQWGELLVKIEREIVGFGFAVQHSNESNRLVFDNEEDETLFALRWM